MVKKAFSTVEIIVVVSLLMILGALAFATGRNASNNNKSNEGSIILQSLVVQNQAISMKEDTYPLFPSVIKDLYPSGKYSFVITASTEENVISIDQVSTSKLVMTVKSGSKCWILVDINDGNPYYGVDLETATCLASNVSEDIITSHDVKAPTEVNI